MEQNYMGYPQGVLDNLNYSQDESSLVKQTNPSETLKDIEMTLRGKKFDDEKKEWYLPTGCQALLNELGLNSIMADARGIINQNTILSNFDMEQISQLIVNLGDVIRMKLSMNWKEFGVDKGNLSTILYSVCNPAYAALMRAKDQGEKKFLKTSVRSVESYNTQGKPSSFGQEANSTVNKLKFWRA